MNGYRDENGGSESQITEVWAHNLEEEFRRIRDVVEKYQYIAMDTEFPGIVARPTGNVSEYNYQTVKYNVNLLKVIQLGITFADEFGNLNGTTSTWQFNFRFDLDKDMYAQDSIDFLISSGIDFAKQQKDGIDVNDFGELIMSSGLVMNEDIKWISFHGCYDFGYLLKLLTCEPLPHNENSFFELLHIFFPSLYDIKYLLKNIKNFNFNNNNSLQKISESLNVKRIGQQHQAGSDSLVTCKTFFKLIENHFKNKGNEEDINKFSGIIYGLGMSQMPKHIRIQQQFSLSSSSISSSNNINSNKVISSNLHLQQQSSQTHGQSNNTNSIHHQQQISGIQQIAAIQGTNAQNAGISAQNKGGSNSTQNNAPNMQQPYPFQHTSLIQSSYQHASLIPQQQFSTPHSSLTQLHQQQSYSHHQSLQPYQQQNHHHAKLLSNSRSGGDSVVHDVNSNPLLGGSASGENIFANSNALLSGNGNGENIFANSNALLGGSNNGENILANSNALLGVNGNGENLLGALANLSTNTASLQNHMSPNIPSISSSSMGVVGSPILTSTTAPPLLSIAENTTNQGSNIEFSNNASDGILSIMANGAQSGNNPANLIRLIQSNNNSRSAATMPQRPVNLVASNHHVLSTNQAMSASRSTHSSMLGAMGGRAGNEHVGSRNSTVNFHGSTFASGSSNNLLRSGYGMEILSSQNVDMRNSWSGASSATGFSVGGNNGVFWGTQQQDFENSFAFSFDGNSSHTIQASTSMHIGQSPPNSSTNASQAS